MKGEVSKGLMDRDRNRNKRALRRSSDLERSQL